MADSNRLRQQLSPIVDQITQDIQIIESSMYKIFQCIFLLFVLFFIARNLSSKSRVENSINEATKLVCLCICT